MCSVKRFVTGWTVQGLNLWGSKNFRLLYTRPDRPWGPPSLLSNGYRSFFQGIKRPRHGVDHSPPSSAEVEDDWSYTFTTPLCLHGILRGDLYLYLYRYSENIDRRIFTFLFSLIQIREQRTDDRVTLLKRLSRRRFLAFAAPTFVILPTFIYFLGQPSLSKKVFLPHDPQLFSLTEGSPFEGLDNDIGTLDGSNIVLNFFLNP